MEKQTYTDLDLMLIREGWGSADADDLAARLNADRIAMDNLRRRVAAVSRTCAAAFLALARRLDADSPKHAV